jgi:hypothetical protein
MDLERLMEARGSCGGRIKRREVDKEARTSD